MRRNCIIIGLVLTGLFTLICLVAGGVVVFRSILNPTFQARMDELRVDLQYIVELQQRIKENYVVEDTKIGIMNGHILDVNLINSEFNNFPRTEQAERARAVALFVKQNFAGIAKIDQITISFTNQSKVGMITSTSTNNFSFNVNELEEK